MADMLEETLRSAGAETGVPDAPKPEDIVALENAGHPYVPGMTAAEIHALVGQPPSAPAEQPPTPPPATPAPTPKSEGYTDEEIAALQTKLEAGGDLTDDEKAIVAMINNTVEEPPPPEAKVFKVGDKVLTEDDMEKQMREEWGIGSLRLSEENRARMLQTYHKALNKTEFSRRVQQDSQLNAAARQQNLADREALEAQSRALQEKRMEIELRARTVQMERSQIEKERKRLEGILANPVTQEQLERYDPATMAKYVRETEARDKLKDLETEQQRIEQSDAQVRQEKLVNDVLAFVEAQPQYKTSADVFTTWDKVRRGEQVSAEDKLKVLELDHIITTAMSRGIPVNDQFAYEKQRGSLAVKAAQAPEAKPTATPRLPELPNTRTLAQKVAEYRKKMAGAPPTTPAGGGGPNHPNASGLPTAHDLIRRDQSALGQGNKDALKDIW